MNDKKLKPEHRKLWRRVYFYEFEELRHTAEDSANMADKVVAQWEARGAFDDGDTPCALFSVDQAISIIDHAINAAHASATTISVLLAPISKDTLRVLMVTYDAKGWVTDERPAPMPFGHHLILTRRDAKPSSTSPSDTERLA